MIIQLIRAIACWHEKATYSSDVIEPNKWFESFVITPVEGIEMNNPNLVENWVKYIKGGTPVYVFTINQE